MTNSIWISSVTTLRKQSTAAFPARFNTTFSDSEWEMLLLSFLIQAGFNNTAFPPQLILAFVLR